MDDAMFSYYGSKSKIIDLYPAPEHNKIIEPFAGSARYALKYWDRDILLVDKYPVIVDLWKWLRQATYKDIIGLPDIEPNQSIDDFDLPLQAKYLIGFCINGGSAQPKKTAKMFCTWNKVKPFIANNLKKIRHWKIELGDFATIENQTATWFIDPPYQVGGEWYVKSNKDLDYKTLSSWATSRYGQVIVCENTKANWLPFIPIGNLHGAYSTTTESIWTNTQAQLTLQLTA